MENKIDRLEIENFKSIKRLELDCKRVNIFIGKPNVGKSNILEAMSLTAVYYDRNEKKFLSDFIRYEVFSNLFYDSNIREPILIKCESLASSENFVGVYLKHMGNNYLLMPSSEKNLLLELAKPGLHSNRVESVLFEFPNEGRNNRKHITIEETGKLISERNSFYSIIRDFKKYHYRTHIESNSQLQFLSPPYGENLFSIIRYNNDLYENIIPFFEEYGLQIVFREREKVFEVQKNIRGRIYDYPYSSIADTLQRIIFYLAAIESNKDSVLIFEEPEAHAFPPYTKMLAHRIADDENNQYFLTTHSPYLLKTLIENTPFSDLNIYLTYYEDYQTKVKLLSKEQMREGLEEDIFFNLDELVNYVG